MGDNDVSDFTSLLVGECNRDAAGINRHTVVDQKAGQALLQGGDALIIKRTR
jgi:hypothetical protein